MDLATNATPRDFAAGAAWHLQQGLDRYRWLEVERTSNFSNPEVVRDRARQVSFELNWAVSDLERALPAVAGRDAELAGRLQTARDGALDVVRQMADQSWSPQDPPAIVQGARDARRAAELLA